MRKQSNSGSSAAGAGGGGGGGVASSVLVAVRVRPFHRGEDAASDAHLVQIGADGRSIHLAEVPHAPAVPSSTFNNNANGGGNNPTNSHVVAVTPSSHHPQSSSSGGSVIRHTFAFDQVFADPIHKHVHMPQQQQQSTSMAGLVSTSSTNRQQDVYAYLGPILCQHTMQSYNSCLFAYGQTGSGKTYSMIGRPSPPVNNNSVVAHPPSVGEDDEDDGIVPRLCVELFQRMKEERDRNSSVTHRVECTFVEIYCERVRDLITGQQGSSSCGSSTTTPPQLPLGHQSAASQATPHSLRIRQHPSRGPYVEGAQLVPVKDAADVIHLLQAGLRERATAETKMNDQSSRSHAILQLHVTRVEVARASTTTSSTTTTSLTTTPSNVGSATGASAVVTKTRTSKLNLVDLAGSERVLQSGATSGDRFEEARNINLSLHSLGRVIQILADRGAINASAAAAVSNNGSMASSSSSATTNAAAPPQQFTVAPYRESVLTWLLSDSLGGNSKTIMLATVAPSSMCHSQTINTLRFACIAKKIVNVASINEDSHFHRLVSELREQILRLTLQLEESSKKRIGATSTTTAVGYEEDNTDGDGAASPLEVARRAAVEAEAVVCEQSATIRELKEKIETLEEQVRCQEKQLHSQVGLVEQCSRARLELHATHEELVTAKRRLGDLENEVEALKSANEIALTGGAAWSREGSPGLDLELLNGELRHQLEELTTQRNAANMRRERAEVTRTELQIKLDKALEELKGSEAARSVAQRELDALRSCPLSSSTLGTPQKLRPMTPPVVRSVPRSNAVSPIAVKSISALTEGEGELMSVEQFQKSVADAVQAREEVLRNEHRATIATMTGDIHELEQLLLEETESSQRQLLASMLDTQASHLHRNFWKSLGRLQLAVATRREGSYVRLLTAEASQRAALIAEHVTVLAPRDSVWAWAEQRATILAAHDCEKATKSLTDEVARWKRDAKAQAQEASLLQSSLQKLNRAREASSARLTVAEEENANLFRMLSTVQASHDETKEELRVAEEALQAAEIAMQTEEQRRRLENALEDDIDDLKGVLSVLTKENRFVHATNSDMTSRYDSVIHKLRSERQRLHQELNDAHAAEDKKLRQLHSDYRREKEALEDERDQLAAELEESKASARRLSRQLQQQQQEYEVATMKPPLIGCGMTNNSSSPRTPLSERQTNS